MSMFYDVLLILFNVNEKTLENTWKQLKTSPLRETVPSTFSVIPRYSQPGEITVWPTRSLLLLRQNRMQLLFHPQLGSGYALKVEEMKSKQQTQAGIALNCVEHLGGHAMINSN